MPAASDATHQTPSCLTFNTPSLREFPKGLAECGWGQNLGFSFGTPFSAWGPFEPPAHAKQCEGVNEIQMSDTQLVC
jgi:hypothetical protein